MSETQVLMAVSDFSGFFLGTISWKGALLLNGGGKDGGEGSKKIIGRGGALPPCPPLWGPLLVLQLLFDFSYYKAQTKALPSLQRRQTIPRGFKVCGEVPVTVCRLSSCATQ